jgi:hypothetical protein
MADDSTIKPESPVGSNPPGTSIVMVKGNNGSYHPRIKDDKTGHFVKTPKPLPSAIEVTRTMRKFLAKVETGQTESRITRILENMTDIAMNDQVDIKTGQRDAKAMMAAVKAFEALWLRAYGKPALSDDEKEALKHSGVKIVIVQPPTLMNPNVLEESTEEKKTQPSFVDAEVIQQN